MKKSDLTVILFLTFAILYSLCVSGQTVIVDPYRFGPAPGNNLLTGLQAYYKTDEASGNLLDASGNARHMTQFGTLESIDGKVVTSRNHDSGENDDYFAIANAAWNTLGTSDFTIAYWFNPNAFASGTPQDQYHIAKADLAGQASWAMGVDRGFLYSNEFALVFYRSTDGTFSTFGELMAVELPQTLDANDVWWFAAITRSGNNFTLYVARETDTNLSLTDTATEALTIFDSSSVPLTVGGFLTGGTPDTTYDAEGAIDEIGIWNKALSACELLKVFNAGAARAFSTFDANPCL